MIVAKFDVRRFRRVTNSQLAQHAKRIDEE